jgi:integrase
MNLQQLIERYVNYRQALGERFATNERILRAFGRALGKSTNPNALNRAQVLAFVEGSGPFTSACRKRYDAIRGLWQYSKIRGYITLNFLPADAPKWPPAFVPYLYTREQIKQLLMATDTYPYSTLCMPRTARTILLLLYGTGVRIREAIRLNDADIDFKNRLITIRETKFYKSRLVPISNRLNRALARYHEERWPTATNAVQQPFFRSRIGARINQDTFTKYFRRLCKHTGICRGDEARYQPRLHDLRHTFAVHRLTSWYQQGANVQKLLPKLSVYLGHVNVTGTQVYLTMTPELLQAAGSRFERYAGKKVADE